jgi:hypothetical protein
MILLVVKGKKGTRVCVCLVWFSEREETGKYLLVFVLLFFSFYL